jgi:hypothetical protein
MSSVKRDPTFQITIRRNRRYVARATVIDRADGFVTQVDWPVFSESSQKLAAILLCVLATVERDSLLGADVRATLLGLGIRQDGQPLVDHYVSPDGTPIQFEESSSGDLPF